MDPRNLWSRASHLWGPGRDWGGATATSNFWDMQTMGGAERRCVLLADPHHGVSEAVRSLLATTFDAVIMVADEISLFEGAGRLRGDLTIVDLALSRGNGLDLVRRLRDRFPHMNVIVV